MTWRKRPDLDNGPGKPLQQLLSKDAREAGQAEGTAGAVTPGKFKGEKDQAGRVGMWGKAEGGDGVRARLEMVKSGKEFVFDSACYGKPMKPG